MERTWENYYSHKSAEILKEWRDGAIAMRKGVKEADGDKRHSPLERRVRAYTDEFVAGDTSARGIVWNLVWPVLRSRAARFGVPFADAGDVATDAMAYVESYVERNEGEVKSLMALFNNALGLFVMRYSNRKHNPEVLDGDLILPAGEDDEDVEDALLSIEEARMRTGGVPHEWLTVINLADPEGIHMAEGLLKFLETAAIEACGREAWDAYYANVVLDQPQEQLAQELGVNQATVSRRISDVQQALLKALGK